MNEIDENGIMKVVCKNYKGCKKVRSERDMGRYMKLGRYMKICSIGFNSYIGSCKKGKIRILWTQYIMIKEHLK